MVLTCAFMFFVVNKRLFSLRYRAVEKGSGVSAMVGRMGEERSQCSPCPELIRIVLLITTAFPFLCTLSRGSGIIYW